MESPLVSIIVPIYNAAMDMVPCLESIKHQRYQNLEVLLVNDGSSDASLEICRMYARLDPRVIIIDKENTGVSGTRNVAIERARSKYLQFVDSDDQLDPNATRLLVEAAEETQADLVICNYCSVMPDGKTTVHGFMQPYTRMDKAQFARCLMEEPASFYYGVMWNKLYRAEVWKLLHYPEGRLHEDDFVAHRLFWRCDKVVCVDKVLYHYRLRGGSICRTNTKPEAFDAVDGLADRYRFYVENGADRAVIDAAYAACWRRYLFLCAKVRQNPTPQLVKAISKEQFLMQGLISYLPNCRNMKMTEKLSAARWAMMPAESLCPAK